jgi:hypothetical protein
MDDDERRSIRGDDLAEDAASGGAQPAGGVMGGDGVRGDGLAHAHDEERPGDPEDVGEDGLRGDRLADEG